MEIKICTKCKKEKDIECFALSNRNTDGHVSVCKECINIRTHERRLATPREEMEQKAAKRRAGVVDKVCSSCYLPKPVSEFYPSLSTGDGYDSICKDCKCMRANVSKYIKNQLFKKGYRVCNKCGYTDKIENFPLNKDNPSGHHAICYSCLNKTSLKHGQKESSKLRKKIWSVEYGIKNRKRLSKKASEYILKKYNEDELFKLEHLYKHSLNIALKSKAIKPRGKAINYLGCSLVEFKKYIESKWEDGMNWGNHTIHGWHVDHIRPLASFDLRDENQLRECFHYTNLQPIWAEHNWSKGSLYQGERAYRKAVYK